MKMFEGMGGKSIWIRVVLALAAGLIWWLAHKPAPAAVYANGQADPARPVRSIDIHASQYKFEPAEITLKQGEPVKLVLISDDVPHGLAVAGLPIHSDMSAGRPTIVELTPRETGNFSGRCSKFCGSGHREMHFVVHVVP